MSDTWTIREAIKEDAGTIIQLLQDTIAYHGMSHKYKGVALEEFIEDCFGNIPWVYCLVVEKKGKPSKLIGYTAYYFTYNSKLGRGIYMIDLFVIPSERSKGIGLAMMKEIAKIGINKRCTNVCWDISGSNKRAIDFYERLGAKIDWHTSFMSLDALCKLSSES